MVLTRGEQKFRLVKQVLWQVLLMNILVAGLKIGVGLISGILSMVADGFHSLMDSSSNIIGLVALRIAQAPPDHNHPYGHRKAETLAALFIGTLLLFTTLEILRTALAQLLNPVEPNITALSYIVLGVTIVINIAVSLYEHRRGQTLQSEILLADAKHTRTDVGVSLTVLAGLLGIQWGLGWLDAVVTLGIAGLIGYSAFSILKQAIDVLMDHATLPEDGLAALALDIPEVQSVERIRSRGRADERYVDLHVRVHADTPTDYAHQIAHAVQDRIRHHYTDVQDITVHIEPEPPDEDRSDHAARRLKTIAFSLGAEAHDVWLYRLRDHLHAEMHLEVPADLSLEEAHQIASDIEAQSYHQLPDLSTVTTHIEPRGEVLHDLRRPAADVETQLVHRARHLADTACGYPAAHDVKIRTQGEQFVLSMHCSLPASMSIQEAHEQSRQVEAALRRGMPQLSRVTVHVEPHL